jgi:hypothetical protein
VKLTEEQRHTRRLVRKVLEELGEGADVLPALEDEELRGAVLEMLREGVKASDRLDEIEAKHGLEEWAEAEEPRH